MVDEQDFPSSLKINDRSTFFVDMTESVMRFNTMQPSSQEQ